MSGEICTAPADVMIASCVPIAHVEINLRGSYANVSEILGEVKEGGHTNSSFHTSKSVL